ncbi:MAG: type II toxin-antitoxin system VapC family toxin [Crocosphaera sp.]|nr:type II toxin-antitoxin system VapC family toxin [Crocosphaera sp.]
MNILLDSHALIWVSQNSPKLSTQAITIFEDPNNTLYCSLVSVWEMQIKVQLGKLKLEINLSDMINDQMQTNDIRILPIRLFHIWTLDSLDHYHKDPFDRLLIAQAINENLTILSVDSVFDNYPVKRLW